MSLGSSTASHITLAGISFVVGMMVWSGSHPAEPPHTKVVKVEVPKTHVVHDTKTVTKPLPDSCMKVIELASTVNDVSSDVTTRAARIDQALDELAISLFTEELAVNDADVIVQRQKDAMEATLAASLEATSTFPHALDLCEADIEESNNGG